MNNNKCFLDNTLSLQAKGLLITMMVMDNEARLQDFIKEEDVICTEYAIKELEQRGYLRIAETGNDKRIYCLNV